MAISAKSQLIVGEVDPYILVTNVLVSKGIETKNIIYTGEKRSSGFFENGESTKLKMGSGVILSSGIAVDVKGPNNDDGSKKFDEISSPGNSLFEPYATGPTFDAVVLQFDFKPQTDNIVFNYIFASEEYPEFVDKDVNDIFGFFISGPGIVGEKNVALVPGTNLPVSIDNVNGLRNTAFYKINPVGDKTLQPDGLTTILTADLKLQPCEFYRIKLAIADVGDYVYDSYVFIEAGSFKHKTNIGRDTFICVENFDVELDAGNAGNKVLWSTGETTQKIKVNKWGEYWVEVFTDCGSFKDYKKILPGVNQISLGPDTIYCGKGLSRVLEVKNRSFNSYLWSDGSKGESLTVTQPGWYWLEIDNGGCKRKDSVFIDLKPLPMVNLGKDTIVCGDVNLILNPKDSGTTYLWNTGATTSRLMVNAPGYYSVLMSKEGCSNKDSILIQSRLTPNIDLGIPERDICSNDTLKLRTGIRDTSNYRTIWNTGETSSAISINQSGKYSVTVTDKLCNYSGRDSVNVKVYNGEGDIWVPNAFTPDNNGINDVFKPVTDILSFNYYTFLVFNRWGEKLFESNDPTGAWNGYFQNKLCETGVYMWTLNVKTNCSKGDKNFQKGIVHLLR